MSSNNDVIDYVKCLGAQAITIKSSQNIVRPPLAVSSIAVLFCGKKQAKFVCFLCFLVRITIDLFYVPKHKMLQIQGDEN